MQAIQSLISWLTGSVSRSFPVGRVFVPGPSVAVGTLLIADFIFKKPFELSILTRICNTTLTTQLCITWELNSKESNLSLGASSPLCYKYIRKGVGYVKHSCLVSYLLRCWRHVSATVGHLQVTKCIKRETIQCAFISKVQILNFQRDLVVLVYPY